MEANLLHYHGSIEDHVRLLNDSEKVLQNLVNDVRIQDAALPSLVHADLHKRYIYVLRSDPTVITGIIDWQLTTIDPAFYYANETPDFASLPTEASTEDMGQDTLTADNKWKIKDASICYQTYDVILTGLVPKLRPARLLDSTMFRLFYYCHMHSLNTDSDGWMPNEDWEATKKDHKTAYELWIETAPESDDSTIEKAEKLWPFDSR
jgi:Phosphotransferase enzyme family